MTALGNTWINFTAAPHRVMFFGGALQIVAVMVWWLADMAGRYGVVGKVMEWTILPYAAHVYLMLYGLFISFIFGFVMTTFPRWMGGREIKPRRYVSAFALLLLGNVLFYVGLLTHIIVLQAALLVTLAGWATGVYALLRVVLDTPPSDKTNPIVILQSLAFGWIGLAVFLIYTVTDNVRWLQIATQLGLWLFLVPLFVSVGHRMIPFFTMSALPQVNVPRPNWPWWVLLAASFMHGMLQLNGATAWLWIGDGLAMVAVFYLSYSWGFLHSFKNPLLSILHVGFAWLGVALLLYTAQSAALFSSSGTTFILGMAPLHALTIGFFASLVIGMGTRVTLGHSGLPFVVDTALQAMFIGIQLAAILRVLADVMPHPYYISLYLFSAFLWLVCFVPWVVRYLPAYWRARADGKPG